MTLILGLTILSIVIIGYVSINSILRAGQSAQVVSNDVLQQQAEDFLLQVTADNAAAAASEFEDLRLDTDHIAQFIANVYSNRDDFASQTFWRAEDSLFEGPDGQYING
ncbi:MAG: hypothetical protein KC413_15790, partial [Anaerolineales bacterium]|nr:hypothetical protein [Anaerolineales bacterium]